MREGVADRVRAAGGEVYAISSEPQALAGRATTDWQLDFACVGDPHQEIAATCRRRDWLDLFVNERFEFLERSVGAERGFRPAHPKGYFQPGVLALAADGRVLYRWRCVPSRRNIGGAVERPTPAHAWDRVEAALKDADAGDAPLDADPPLDSRGIPWPLFVALIVANGRFLAPRGFASTRHIPWAGAGLLGFAAAWVAAFAWLPTLPVAAALAGWGAFIAPKVRWVGREFQDAESDVP